MRFSEMNVHPRKELSEDQTIALIAILRDQKTYGTEVAGCLGQGLGLSFTDADHSQDAFVCLHCRRVIMAGGKSDRDLILSEVGESNLRRFFQRVFPDLPKDFHCDEK